MCFQILGLDIFMDSRAKPWLLEVDNQSPFATESDLDEQIKSELIEETLKILDLSHKKKV